jgi:hypothetical protein
VDVKGLRTLNLIGVIFYVIVGSLLALQYFYISFIFTASFRGHYNPTFILCGSIWFSAIVIFTLLLYHYTVLGLDRGEYQAAKTWTFIGIFVGVIGGIIPLIIYIISYVSFDDAVRTSQYGPAYYPPTPIQNRPCIKCRRQIPLDSKLCPYCGVQQYKMQKSRPPPPQKVKPKPLPPPPKKYKKD